jgi:hypothetical protein
LRHAVLRVNRNCLTNYILHSHGFNDLLQSACPTLVDRQRANSQRRAYAPTGIVDDILIVARIAGA